MANRGAGFFDQEHRQDRLKPLSPDQSGNGLPKSIEHSFCCH